MLAGDAGGEPGEIVEAVCTAVDVDRQRLADRLAGIQNLEPGQLVLCVGAGPPPPGAGSGRARHRPWRTSRAGPASGGNGGIDVGRIGPIDLAQLLARGRVEAGEPLAGPRSGARAVDEQGQGLQQHGHHPDWRHIGGAFLIDRSIKNRTVALSMGRGADAEARHGADPQAAADRGHRRLDPRERLRRHHGADDQPRRRRLARHHPSLFRRQGVRCWPRPCARCWSSCAGTSCRRCARPSGPRHGSRRSIDASFTERQFQPQVIVTWLAFWGQAPHDPALARLQRIYAHRLTSHLRHDLRPLVGDARRPRWRWAWRR